MFNEDVLTCVVMMQSITELAMADIPDVDLSVIGTSTFGDFEVEVIDYTTEYFACLKEVFDFDMLKAFLARPNFKCAAASCVSGITDH